MTNLQQRNQEKLNSLQEIQANIEELKNFVMFLF